MEEKGYSVIGKPVPRVDGIIKTKGEAVYTTDISLPGMLYGKILRSPYPHARILRIDTSKAERLRGVRAVITGEDIPKIKYGSTMIMFPEAADEYLLAQDKVNFIGDEIAGVAAASEDIAEEALGLIEVEYEVLPVLLSIGEATKPGAPLIHEGFPGNISAMAIMDFGDVEKGFQESDYVREDRFVTQIVQHCSMEPHVSLANFDSSGKVTLWTSTQAPFLIKLYFSKVLDIPEGNVRVIKPHMGGGFGGKVEVLAIDLCCALLSKKTGKPVKICYTREEEFAAARRRHPMEIDLKIGVKRDGTIVARQGKMMLDGGAYSSSGPAATFLTTMFLLLPYKTPNVKFESCRVYTNKAPCGAMRGYGAPQVQFAGETQIDMVAEELGMDPADFRIKNGLRAGDITVSGLKMSSGSLEDCVQKVVENSEWKKRYMPKRIGTTVPEREPHRTVPDNGKTPLLKGIGLTGIGFMSGSSLSAMGPSVASSTIFIKANMDGTVMIISGVSDIGQGSDTVLCQIAAEELGIRVEDVSITLPDTALTPPDMVSASSRVTFMAGNASKRAAFDLKQKLFKAVSEKLEANVQDLEARDRRIYVKGSPEKGVTFAEAVAICQMSNNGMTIMGEGSYNPDPGPLDIKRGYGNYSPAYTYGAVVGEVEVDQETGRVKIDKLIFCHDCGRVINLLGIESQLQGAVAMGVGYALFEDLIVKDGKTLNPCFLEYKLPTAMEMPEIESALVESNDPGGPFGAKEGAEGCVAPVAPAILNAIYNATGLRFNELPVTPEKILRGLKSNSVGTRRSGRRTDTVLPTPCQEEKKVR